MKPLSVYVHVPFCTVKCGYCDFNAYAGMDSLKTSYGQALVAEIGAWRHAFDGREVNTIGFGGGTPGEMQPGAIAAVIESVRRQTSLAADAEISLEANPGTTSLEYLQALQAAGVNRISFGAQSFDAAELVFLDRIHSPQAIGAAVRLARLAGIESVGLDLIYGLPGQQLASWLRSVEAAIDVASDHLACYALTIEDGTPLAERVNRGEVVPLDPDSVADMYEMASDRLSAVGFRQYEISNWARPGHESRHNQVYWTDGDYLGVGAGAHGFVAGERYENMAHPRAYTATALPLRASGARPNTVIRAYRPDQATAMFDWVTLALRRIDGFEPAQFEQRFGATLADALGEPLDECAAAGILEFGDRVQLTSRGRLMHGEVAVRVLAHLQRGV